MKTALITGASSGIGKELAYIHAKNNGNLVLVARNLDNLKKIKDDLKSRFKISIHIISKDLTKADAPQEVYDEVISENIKIDYLINNAGFGGVGRFHERNLTDDLNMIQLNVITLTALTHLFLKDFLKTNTGSILNVSSTASYMPGPLQSVYFATKAFVTSFTNAIAEECSATNVSVTNLMPGATETNFGAISGMDKTDLFKKTASANSVARDGYKAMINGKLDCVSGLTLSQKILISLIPITPKKIILKVVKKLQKTKEQ
ncbi:MAG: SDR family NAD(P)-dependent oxidoreductase [Wenyingzhuangia sp.]|jgi:uncharacterized protein|uniref:SDR family NAD(P)-dependent oxidoreductase n=1 Tax=Wenyingzhuangia sp. TaxID=1964193 RepID=UPI00321BA65B